jgi:hypothetical protein
VFHLKLLGCGLCVFGLEAFEGVDETAFLAFEAFDAFGFEEEIEAGV